ncbi:hypothetical protein [Paenibacillus lemnae]|uniref:CPBP family intramembrane metalloprotease n=1 Tax=Paenibacillus lemnae TaxID=1330551 RepID=A0A848M2D6_PAELE|nr:hypothetical protein [Paenibacillus lemnae]NMO95148.1 hypothetical protein [Paenibacillus lemnae]
MKQNTKSIVLLVTAACILMAVVDAVITPDYLYKSIIKVMLFLTLPVLYARISKEVSFRPLFRFEKKGLLFNWLNEKNGNIYASWMVHMCANLAINTIGFMLFEIW